MGAWSAMVDLHFRIFSSLLYLLRVEVVKTKEGGLGEGFHSVANPRLDRL